MKRHTAISLGLLMAVAGCDTAAQTARPEPIEISIARTACFGTCPDYKVTMRQDGTVTYTGRQFVRVTGEHTWTIDPAEVRALADEMARAGYFELKDDYQARVTDHPTTYTTLVIGARSKTIKDYVAGPPVLKDLQKRIDEVSGVKKYVSPDDPLLRAVESGDAAAVRALLDAGANARAADEDRVTLVMRAAATGNAETVRLLLAAGGDPTARDRFGRNAADRARDGIAAGTPKPFDLILKLLTDE